MPPEQPPGRSGGIAVSSGPGSPRRTVPYALIAPAVVVIVAILGYPIYFLVRLSFEHYGLFQLIAHKGEWVGLKNFTTILTDGEFWRVVLRSVLFTAVNVGLTMVLGTLIAFLLKELGRFMRTLVTAALVLAWSMPVVVATQLWLWMTNYENGVVNYVFTKLHFGNFIQYDWFANTIVGFGVITSLIVWGAVPFVAVTVYAGLTQVPGELLEAAAARRLRRVRALPRHHLPDPEADLRDPHEPLDHLGLPGVHAAVPAPPAAARPRLLADEHLRLREVVRHLAVRPRLGDRARDARADARRDVLLHPPDDPDRRGQVNA